MCRRTTTNGNYCEECRAKRKAKTNKERNARGDNKFYNSSAWRKLRNRFIQVHPLCTHCMDEDRTTEAKEIDHIKAIEDGGEPLDWNNLQSLCKAHHTKKTNRERAERNRKG